MPIGFTFVPGANGKAGAFFSDPTIAGFRLAQAAGVGFERVVVHEPGGVLANLDVAAYAARLSSALEIVLTHWPGAIAPVAAAQQLAELDTRIGGRLVVRVLGDGHGAPDNGRAPHPCHLAAMQRTDEYLMLLKRLWTNTRPFDFEGAFHSFRQGFLHEKGPRAGEISFRMGGDSGSAIQVAARHADVFELSPGSAQSVRQQIERVRDAAGRYGRSRKISFALPVYFNGGSQKDPDVVAEPMRRAANIAAWFLDYVDAGVAEFMVSGTDDGDAMRLFGERVVTPLRIATRRNEFRCAGDAIAHWPVAPPPLLHEKFIQSVTRIAR